MTQEEVMQIMTDMGLHEGGMGNWVADNAWFRFAKLVAQHERESCARLCDALAVHPEYVSEVTKLAALAIRARGNT